MLGSERWLKDWRKIVLYAFCTALFVFILYWFFASTSIGRYKMIYYDGEPALYIDTATGEIYRIRDGKQISSPQKKKRNTEILDELHKLQILLMAYEDCKPLEVREYIVEVGDSLLYISHKMGIDVETIKGSNNLRISSAFRPGVKLRIPNQDGIFYTLKDGETVEEVAKRYGVSMIEVRLVNEGVSVTRMKANDEIFLPGAKPISVR